MRCRARCRKNIAGAIHTDLSVEEEGASSGKERMQGPWYLSSESEDHPGALALPVFPELGSPCISMPSGSVPDWDRVWAIAKTPSFRGVEPITLLCLSLTGLSRKPLCPWLGCSGSRLISLTLLPFTTLLLKNQTHKPLQNKSVKCLKKKPQK